jgi:hypothetical protein
MSSLVASNSYEPDIFPMTQMVQDDNRTVLFAMVDRIVVQMWTTRKIISQSI